MCIRDSYRRIGGRSRPGTHPGNGQRAGPSLPVLIKPEESLLECLVLNADPKNDADYYEFDLKTVVEYRKKMLLSLIHI